MNPSPGERGTKVVHIRNVLCEIVNNPSNGMATLQMKLNQSPEFIDVAVANFSWIPKDKIVTSRIATYPFRIETMSDFCVMNAECMRRIDHRSKYQSYHCRDCDLLWIPVTMEIFSLSYQIAVRNWSIPDVVHAKFAGNADLGFIQWNWSEDKLVSTHPEYKKLLDQKLNEEK